MSKRAGKTFNCKTFVTELWGDDFDGHIILWSGHTKKSVFYSSSQIERLCSDVKDRQANEDLYYGLATQP